MPYVRKLHSNNYLFPGNDANINQLYCIQNDKIQYIKQICSIKLGARLYTYGTISRMDKENL